MKNKITLLNAITTLFLQIVTILSGFIIPKLILSTFGSNVNGLVSSLTQFLSYISLVEGGISGVIMATLYKPLVEKDSKKLSSILKTTRNFYKKISIIFIAYTLILATVYPLIFDTGFNYIYVFSLTLILSIALMVQYMFSLTLRSLLNADKKIYIVSITQSIILLLGIALAIITVKIYPNIHILKLLTGILFILQPITYKHFANKYYKIDKNAKEDKSLLKSRWDGFAINVAAFIHNGTDVTILTIFTNLATVSVYSVYALVSTGLKTIINALVSSLNPTIGHAYARKDWKELNQKMDLYEYIVFILVSFTFSLATLLIVPFVMIYTNGINDADYYQPIFAILILISEALYLVKFPHLNLAYSANKFKEISPSGFIEAGINIVLSLILVPFFGLIGVAIGTIIAMTYRMVYHVWFTTKLIRDRKQSIFYSKFIIFTLASLLGIFISNLFIPAAEYTIISWVWHAILYSIIIGIILLGISIVFFKKEITYLKNYLIRKK